MRILVITDTHLAASRDGANANLSAIRAYAAQGRADLTLHLGDITRDAHSTPDELAFAADLLKDWPTPLRCIPGNHDIGDNPPGPDAPSRQPMTPDHLAAYRALFGEDRWAIDAADWCLVGLNAQLFGTNTRDEATQWEWLTHVVEDSAGRPLAILCHKPFFQDRLQDEPPHIRYIPAEPRRRLAALLKQADWRLWLSGHTHQLWDREVLGVRHIWAPSLAYRFPDAMQEKLGEKFVGAGLLNLGATGAVRFDFLAPEGVRQHEYGPAMAEA